MAKEHFTTGPRRLREHFNRQSDEIKSVTGYNLRGDQFITVQNVGGRAHALSLNLLALLKRIPHSRGGGNSTIRLVTSKNDAAANTDPFVCYLDGEEINVSPTCNTTVIAMTGAAPRIYDGTPLAVWKDGTTWRTVVTFEKAGAC